MRLFSIAGNFIEHISSIIFKSRSAELTQPSAAGQSGADGNMAPFVITASTPGVLIENVFPDGYVLRGSECLLHFEAQGLSLYLRLEPAAQAGQTNQASQGSWHAHGTPKFELVFYDAMYRDVLSDVSGDLRERMVGVTFGHVARQPMYQAVLRAFKDAASPKVSVQPLAPQKHGVSTPAVFAIAALVFVSTVLFFSGASNPPAGTPVVAQSAQATNATNAAAVSPQPAVTNPSAGTLPVATSLGDQLNEVEKQILSKVVAESGIELTSGGKPFVIFSDPNCPSCRELEAQLFSMDKSLSPVIVPVSFQRNSAEAVSAILCSANASQAWKIAVAAELGVIPAGGCAKGQAQAEANNAAFAALRFDRTPTIVTSSGKVAVGVKDFDGLAKWIKANS